MALEQAITDLENVAADSSTADINPAAWRTTMRERLQRVRSVMTEPLRSRDGWLVARTQHVDKERSALVERISAMSARIGEARPNAVLPDVRRLSTDLGHYRQRVRDLDYDAVELELGGFD